MHKGATHVSLLSLVSSAHRSRRGAAARMSPSRHVTDSVVESMMAASEQQGETVETVPTCKVSTTPSETWDALPQRKARRKRQRICTAPLSDSECVERKYEYLDHTADVQLHSWGATKAEAFEQAALAMFGYMTELGSVVVDSALDRELHVKGHDLLSLFYAFLDELLFLFSTEDFVVVSVHITSLEEEGEPLELFAKCRGERFDLAKHPQGTEIKAITYSNMQVLSRTESEGGGYECFVIVDI